MLGFVACSDDDDNYQPGTVSGPQVFFPKDTPTQFDLSNSETSFNIPVKRYVTTDALTVPIQLTDTNSVFTVPAEISFAVGDSMSVIPVSYDPTKFEFNDYKEASIAIDEKFATPYGTSELIFKAGVPLTWKSLGKGTIVDNVLEFQDKVTILACEQNPNVYRIMAPYANFKGNDSFEGYDKANEPDDYLELTILQPGDKVGDVTVTLKDLIYYDVFNTGFFNISYSDVINFVHPSGLKSYKDDESGWKHNNVLSYAADGVTPTKLQLAPSYYMFSVGGFNYTQYDGVVEIYFPGNDPLDYDLEVAYMGKNVSPDNVYSANFELGVGADLEEVKYALVSGDDAETILGGILSGSIETESVTASTTISIPLQKAGTYTLMAIGFAQGEAQSYDYETILFEMGGGETWTAVAHGFYSYGVEPLTEGGESAYEGKQEGILYQSSLDETRFRIAPWAHWSSDGLIFTWNKETNVIKANAVDTGENYIEEGEDYGRILFSDLVSFDENYAKYPSTYKPETKTFEFWGTYHFGQYWFGAVIETFVVDDGLEATPASARGMKKGASRSKAHKMSSRFATAKLEKGQI